MDIYGIVRSYVFWGDETSKSWAIAKIERKNDKLIWRELYTEELKENKWVEPWNNLCSSKLREFRKAFNFPYVGKLYHDVSQIDIRQISILEVNLAHLNYYKGILDA